MKNFRRIVTLVTMFAVLMLCSPILAQFETGTPVGDTVPMQPADDLDAIESVPEAASIENSRALALTEDQLEELIEEARNESNGLLSSIVAISLAGAFAVALFAIFTAGRGAPPWLAPLFTEGGKSIYAGTSSFVDARIEEAKETPSPLDDQIWQAAKEYIDQRFADFFNNPPEAVG